MFKRRGRRPRNSSAHVGGAVTVIPPNIWQDNFPHRLDAVCDLSAPRFVVSRAIQLRVPDLRRRSCPMSTLPTAQISSHTNNPKAVPSNTVMDVDRYQRDLAALTDSTGITPLNLSGIDPQFGNRQALYVDARPGAEIRQPDCGCGVCGNGGAASSALWFSQCLSRSHRGFAQRHQVR